MRLPARRTPTTEGRLIWAGNGVYRDMGRVRIRMLDLAGDAATLSDERLPTLASTVPDGPRWAYEIKHDGFRFICRRDGDRVRVYSRWGKDWSDKVPAIVDALAALPVTSATLDGEGVVVDQRGLTDFERLRSALAWISMEMKPAG